MVHAACRLQVQGGLGDGGDRGRLDGTFSDNAASHPIFFSNNSDTEVALDHPGPIYFISGESGHCERGQRMVVQIVGPGTPPPAPPSPQAPTGAATPAGTTGGALAGAIAAVAMALPVIVIGV
ncbi:unnamed protein product [Miscanthus lutarioriparius]|uniref:Phytocyanin domain-containing protein n=1 Tax=Miscanthus lutarioriparius TaxID=422564 RepID=A0A811RJF0_9POAL|nr:unnamed protein product [Miscanthus lutarioriparius]